MRYASDLDGHQPDFHHTAHVESCSPWIMLSDPPNEHCHLSDMIIFETSQQISLLMCAQMLDLIQLSMTFWHNINADVHRYADHSSSASIHRCTGTLLHPQDTSPPDAQFDLVHNDIVGPLPSAKDNMHLLTYVHTFALSHTIARHFHSQSYKPFMGWIAQLFGVPTTLMSDRVGVEGNLTQMSDTT